MLALQAPFCGRIQHGRCLQSTRAIANRSQAHRARHGECPSATLCSCVLVLVPHGLLYASEREVSPCFSSVFFKMFLSNHVSSCALAALTGQAENTALDHEGNEHARQIELGDLLSTFVADTMTTSQQQLSQATQSNIDTLAPASRQAFQVVPALAPTSAPVHVASAGDSHASAPAPAPVTPISAVGPIHVPVGVEIAVLRDLLEQAVAEGLDRSSCTTEEVSLRSRLLRSTIDL